MKRLFFGDMAGGKTDKLIMLMLFLQTLKGKRVVLKCSSEAEAKRVMERAKKLFNKED